MTSENDFEDWRLQGQDKYLRGATLRWKKWWPYREGWDHDHCEFCQRKISEYPDDDEYGWVTEDNYRWVCDQCCENFREGFGWKLVRNEAESE